MSILQEVEQLLSKMTRAEKAKVLQWVVRDLGDAFPGIDSVANYTPTRIFLSRSSKSCGD